MQNELTPAGTTEQADTYEEAFAKKLARERVKDLNVGSLQTPEEKQSKKILVISLIITFILIIGGAAAYYFIIFQPEQTRLALKAAEQAAAA